MYPSAKRSVVPGIIATKVASAHGISRVHARQHGHNQRPPSQVYNSHQGQATGEGVLPLRMIGHFQDLCNCYRPQHARLKTGIPARCRLVPGQQAESAARQPPPRAGQRETALCVLLRRLHSACARARCLGRSSAWPEQHPLQPPVLSSAEKYASTSARNFASMVNFSLGRNSFLKPGPDVGVAGNISVTRLWPKVRFFRFLSLQMASRSGVRCWNSNSLA